MKKQIIRDEIHTNNAEYADLLNRLHREHGMVPHAEYMWRVVDVQSRDFSRTEWIGPLHSPTGEPMPFFVPGPTAWLFALERDETIAPADDPKPNHVRDAVRANLD